MPGCLRDFSHLLRSDLRRGLSIGLLVAGIAIVQHGSAQAAGSSHGFDNTLMPQPSSFHAGQGEFLLSPNFAARVDKYQDERLDQAIRRAMRQLEDLADLQFPIDATAAANGAAPFVVTVDGPGEAVQSVDEDESYSLTVTPEAVHLSAATDVGAMHGLETLLQLVQNDEHGYYLPAVTIQDAPRFRWRGLMIDCSRHFEPISVIERTLDGMAAVKLNVFHWHLSDDQGFRMQSKLFPLLTGAGSGGQYYTQQQAREIVSYARARGIRVIPEFDMPGHTSSWMVGYPQLASAPGPFHIQTGFGVFDPTMDPTRDSTYQFLDKFIGEMVTIFPDKYVHIGGDENNGVEWRQNPRIQAFMRAHHMTTAAELQAYFNQRLLQIVNKHGKHMIGWDEVLTPGLPRNVVIQSWRGYESLAQAARQGYDGLLSAGYYLDHIVPASEFYKADPIPASSDLPYADRAHILGGEACMWGEYVDEHNIDSRIWPRTAAIAERLWSPQSVNDVNDMYRRLPIESLRLERLGLTQISQETAGLRFLAGTWQIGPLQLLASTLEPVDFDVRSAYSHAHNITTLTPFDRVVDALPPDPPFRHQFELLIEDYLKSLRTKSQQAAELQAIFEDWIAAGPGMFTLMDQSPPLAEAKERAAQLSELGNIGLASLPYLSSGQEAPAGWRAAQMEVIKKDASPVALTRFAVLDQIRSLLETVSESPAANSK
jgi:hexosaminidase